MPHATRIFCIFTLAVLLCAPMVGCAQAPLNSTKVEAEPVVKTPTPDSSFSLATIGKFVEERSQLVVNALSLLGVNYKFGGNNAETGLDCSGLVRLVFNQTLGLVLPRRSEEISRVSHKIAPTDLQPGDLVFFNTLRRAFSHVGIYIGNGQFVHAPSSGGAVRVENMGSNYWAKRFDGAGRLAPDQNPVSKP